MSGIESTSTHKVKKVFTIFSCIKRFAYLGRRVKSLFNKCFTGVKQGIYPFDTSPFSLLKSYVCRFLFIESGLGQVCS
jgi:hypothetical protein